MVFLALSAMLSAFGVEVLAFSLLDAEGEVRTCLPVSASPFLGYPQPPSLAGQVHRSGWPSALPPAPAGTLGRAGSAPTPG